MRAEGVFGGIKVLLKELEELGNFGIGKLGNRISISQFPNFPIPKSKMSLKNKSPRKDRRENELVQ
jgi:hypothetical protein